MRERDFSTWFHKTTPILVVALLLRLGVALLLPPSYDSLIDTEPGATALNLVEGRGYTYDFYGVRPDAPLVAFLPPLHPWLIALALRTPDPSRTYGLVQAVLGAGTVWLLSRLARALAGRRVGALVGWGAALYPAHLLLTGQSHSTVLHNFLLAAVLLISWQLLGRPGLGWGAAAGVLTGLLALGRPQMVALLPLAAAWFWLNGVKGRPWRRAVGAMALGTLLVILPWCLRNSFLLGRPAFISTNGGVTFWNGNNPFTTGSAHDVYTNRLAAFRGLEAPDPALPEIWVHPEPYPFPPEIEARLATLAELALDRAAYRAGLAYIQSQPADWLRLELRKLVSFWWFRPNLGANPIYRDHWTWLYRIQYPFLLIPALLGVPLSLGALRTRPVPAGAGRRYLLLYSIPVLYTLVHLTYNVLTRYRWEIELLLLIPAAVAAEQLWLWRRKRKAL